MFTSTLGPDGKYQVYVNYDGARYSLGRTPVAAEAVKWARAHHAQFGKPVTIVRHRKVPHSDTVIYRTYGTAR